MTKKEAITGTEPEFISELELASRLGRHPNTIASWRKSGRLPFIPGGRNGKGIIYHVPSLRAALLRQQREVAA